MSILDNEYMICCMIFFFFFFHPVTTFKRGPHGRLVFAKCVLPSVNKVNYYYYYYNPISFPRAFSSDNMDAYIFTS